MRKSSSLFLYLVCGFCFLFSYLNFVINIFVFWISYIIFTFMFYIHLSFGLQQVQPRGVEIRKNFCNEFLINPKLKVNFWFFFLVLLRSGMCWMMLTFSFKWYFELILLHSRTFFRQTFITIVNSYFLNTVISITKVKYVLKNYVIPLFSEPIWL